MVLQKGKGLPLPVKWFTLAQCWRFERSTRGRRREHYQWNMDCIGQLLPPLLHPAVQSTLYLLTLHAVKMLISIFQSISKTLLSIAA